MQHTNNIQSQSQNKFQTQNKSGAKQYQLNRIF